MIAVRNLKPKSINDVKMRKQMDPKAPHRIDLFELSSRELDEFEAAVYAAESASLFTIQIAVGASGEHLELVGEFKQEVAYLLGKVNFRFKRFLANEKKPAKKGEKNASKN